MIILEIHFADNIWAKIPDVEDWLIAQDLKQVLPSPGVYALLDDCGNMLYIGQASDMRARINEHRSISYTQIWFLPLIDWKARYLVELAAILAFEPKFNKYPEELIETRKAKLLNQQR